MVTSAVAVYQQIVEGTAVGESWPYWLREAREFRSGSLLAKCALGNPSVRKL